jgi:hypothetical protein
VSIFIVAASILAALTECNPQAIRVPRTVRIGAVNAQQPGRQPEPHPDHHKDTQRGPEKPYLNQPWNVWIERSSWSGDLPAVRA